MASIRDVTAWFEATTEGVFTDIFGNTDIDDKSKIRAWRDVNPQKAISNKPIMKMGQLQMDPLITQNQNILLAV